MLSIYLILGIITGKSCVRTARSSEYYFQYDNSTGTMFRQLHGWFETKKEVRSDFLFS
jgi:hypothetical protein